MGPSCGLWRETNWSLASTDRSILCSTPSVRKYMKHVFAASLLTLSYNQMAAITSHSWWRHLVSAYEVNAGKMCFSV